MVGYRFVSLTFDCLWQLITIIFLLTDRVMSSCSWAVSGFTLIFYNRIIIEYFTLGLNVKWVLKLFSFVHFQPEFPSGLSLHPWPFVHDYLCHPSALCLYSTTIRNYIFATCSFLNLITCSNHFRSWEKYKNFFFPPSKFIVKKNWTLQLHQSLFLDHQKKLSALRCLASLRKIDIIVFMNVIEYIMFSCQNDLHKYFLKAYIFSSHSLIY